MAQFDVYENINPETRDIFPYLLDVQADILSNLPTRVVVPLITASAVNKPIPILNPRLEIGQTDVIMSTPQLVGVHLHVLGTRVCSLKDKRDVIITALDLLITGY